MSHGIKNLAPLTIESLHDNVEAAASGESSTASSSSRMHINSSRQEQEQEQLLQRLKKP